MQLRNAQDRNDLLPPKACMNHEDGHAKDVESGPDGVLEELVLQCIDVAHTHRGNCGVISPEKIQRKNSPKIDQITRRSQIIRAELFCVTETELEKVDSHESQEHETRHSQVQRPRPETHSQLLVVRAPRKH